MQHLLVKNNDVELFAELQKKFLDGLILESFFTRLIFQHT